MDKVMNLTYASSLTDLCEANSSFDSGVLRIAYPGDNRNGSNISKEAFEDAIKSIYNCPVVCNYDRESDTLGGHDMEVVKDSDGSIRLVNMTSPIGVIPSGAKVWFEDYEEEDGIVREYLYTEVLLWKRQEAYRKVKKDGIAAHSMEITVKKGHSKDGVYYIDAFEFTAFALIGITPCYESSALEIFSVNNFREEFSQMMLELKESFNLVNPSEEVDDKSMKYSEEGGKEVLEKKKELLEKYNLTEDQIEFDYSEMSDEDFEAKLAEMTAEDVDQAFEADDQKKTPALEEADMDEDTNEDSDGDDEEPSIDPRETEESIAHMPTTSDLPLGTDGNNDEDDSDPTDGDDEEVSDPDTETASLKDDQFALASAVHDALIEKVSKIAVGFDEYGEFNRYCFYDYNPDKSEVYAFDRMEQWNLYGFVYTVSGDEITIDPATRKRMKLDVVEFDNGESEDQALSFADEILELTKKFHTASDALTSMETELDELRQFKADTESAIAEEERANVFAQFEDLVGVEAFEALKADCDLDAEALTEKCFAIRGRMSTKNFSLESKSSKIKIDKVDDNVKDNEPYGGLFIEYGNTRR